MTEIDPRTKQYLAEIGRRGGRKSRRTLSPEAARDMVRVREARKAYRNFHTRCFWSYDPDLQITLDDVPWVAERLMRDGGHEGWELGAKLCR